jgi:hypothetical protein
MSAPVAPAAGDPLAALRGIHLPEPMGLWPPAPGWWLLPASLLLLGAAIVAWRRWRRSRVAYHALRELDRLAKGEAPGDLQTLAASVSLLLRRVALRRFGNARVASLSGDAWQSFLCETSPRGSRRKRGIDEDAGRLLALAPYAPPGASFVVAQGTVLDRKLLLAAAGSWIRGNT